jgi:hypothetical protein
MKLLTQIPVAPNYLTNIHNCQIFSNFPLLEITLNLTTDLDSAFQNVILKEICLALFSIIDHLFIYFD